MSDIDWSKYSEGYDYLMAHNTSYKIIGDKLLKTLADLNIDLDGPGQFVADLGAGTGNFTIQAAQAFPLHRFVLVESNEGMTRHASKKITNLELKNISIQQEDMLQYLEKQNYSLKGIIAIHALYATTLGGDKDYPKKLLERAYKTLPENGFIFIMDIGRPLDVNEWQQRICRDVEREFGKEYLAEFLKKPEIELVRAANQRIYNMQISNKTYNHRLDQLVNLIESVGFKVKESSDQFYNPLPEEHSRGIDDYVLALK